jgi:predicted ATPase
VRQARRRRVSARGPDQGRDRGLPWQRVFEAAELSDGTLRYLALVGLLLAYRQTSLHPDLLEPLARLIADASARTQIWLVTHSERLASCLARHGRVAPRSVIKREGATWLDGLKLTGEFDDEVEV